MNFRPFFEADTVRSTQDPLTKLLRIMFYRLGVSTDDFVRLHGDYWTYWNRGGQHESESTHRSNQRRTLLNDKISWKKFWWLISDLLRLDVLDLSITVRDKHGRVTTYSTRDPIEDMPPEVVSPTHPMYQFGETVHPLQDGTLSPLSPHIRSWAPPGPEDPDE